MKRKKKKVPLRTCLACREIKAKKELLRLVRLPSGEVKFDSTGKLSGRGTYLCPSEDCVEFLDGKKLQHTLEVSLSEGEVKGIQEKVKTYLKEQETGNENS